jgi:hypothetical protein
MQFLLVFFEQLQTSLISFHPNLVCFLASF